MTISFKTATFAASILAGNFFAPAVSFAHEYKIGHVSIGHPWSRVTPSGAAVAGGFMSIENKGATADRLIRVEGDISKSIEVHEMKMESGVMKMRELATGLEIPAGQKIYLKPGSYHVMFMGMKQNLPVGKTFKATLVFEKAGRVQVDFKVEPMDFQMKGAGTHDHAHDHKGHDHKAHDHSGAHQHGAKEAAPK